MLATGVMLLALPAVAQGAEPQQPLRQLQYSFTWGTQNATEEHNSGIGTAGSPGGSGISTYRGSASDMGTIHVDVLKVQTDNVVIVAVTEHARKHAVGKTG